MVRWTRIGKSGLIRNRKAREWPKKPARGSRAENAGRVLHPRQGSDKKDEPPRIGYNPSGSNHKQPCSGG